MNWHDHFTLDYTTGILYWKERPRSMFRTDRGWRTFNAQRANKAIKCSRRGYVVVRLFNKLYQVHRIVFEMANNRTIGDNDVDHSDGMPSNNRPENLRAATVSQNMMNARLRKDNTSGLKGVYWSHQRNKWFAKLVVNRKQVHLGFHETRGLAAVARAKGALRLHGQFARFT
jgi:hypothetical protein